MKRHIILPTTVMIDMKNFMDIDIIINLYILWLNISVYI